MARPTLLNMLPSSFTSFYLIPAYRQAGLHTGTQAMHFSKRRREEFQGVLASHLIKVTKDKATMRLYLSI